MKIVVNCQLLPGAGQEGGSQYIEQIFNPIISAQPQHEFIFLTGANQLSGLIKANNSMQLPLLPNTRNLLLLKWWHRFKLPSILKQHRASILVSAGGFGCANTTLPQLLFLTDLPFLSNNIRRNMVMRLVRQVQKVIVPTATTKNQLMAGISVVEEKFVTTGMGISSLFVPIDDLDARQQVKDKFSNGKEYFLYTGAITPQSPVINILKAFSIFKKRQRCNLQLVIAGNIDWPNNEFSQKLSTYKYREDVHVHENLSENELAQLMGAGYGLLYPYTHNIFPIPVLQAMQSGLPIIALSSVVQEVADYAALYPNSNSVEDIAGQMMILYKDENLRNIIVANGLQKCQEYSWRNAADQVWEAIEEIGK